MINIAIDGFTGSGKSTLAKLLAAKLGNDFKILDTGAIFRALAYSFNSFDKDLNDDNLNSFLKDIKLKVAFEGNNQKIYVNKEDVTPFLRTEDIGQLASKISVFPQVRDFYLEIAKRFAKDFNCIMEGRDIGTIVMPNADVKIFLTADEKVRAKRRFQELASKNIKTSFDEVLKDLIERDNRDSSRPVAPLMPTVESVIVDNSEMDLDQTADYCVELINKVLKNDEKINIAIDGYVCSGKSTIARALAKKLNFKVFDTGAVYRGIACAFDYMNYDQNLIDESYICNFAKQINVKIEFIENVEHVFVNGIDYTPFLRTEKTSMLAAKISPFTCVRNKVLKIQRAFARNNNVVMEGRDIGSKVLPDADFKFFCTADDEVRAKRRYEQHKAIGENVDYFEILKELRDRDDKDVHRENGAIKVLKNSIIIDTTNQGLDQSVEFCIKIIKDKFPNIKIY